MRDRPENLILLCGICHDDLDHPDNLDVLTVEHLLRIKEAHENRIHQILSVPPARETTVLRLQGTIGDSNVGIDRSVAAAAVVQHDRVARFQLSHDLTGIEIDLRQVPASVPGNANHYANCRTIIDRVIDRQLAPAVEEGSVQHISVFALARWPLLVHLGARIGDKLDTDIYQRHRASESWAWPSDGQDNRFTWDLVKKGAGDDAVLVLSLSAAVRPTEIPTALATFRSYRITPATDITPHYDIIGTSQSLKSAEKAFRDVLADIEQNRKTTRRLHVIGAAPLSACVTLGRVLTRGIHPPLILYDRVNDTYQRAMEID